jgi:hypothetical protein
MDFTSAFYFSGPSGTFIVPFVAGKGLLIHKEILGYTPDIL